MGEPQLLLTSSNRQRLVQHLLRLEAQQNATGPPPSLNQTAQSADLYRDGEWHQEAPEHLPTGGTAMTSTVQRPTLSVAETAELLGISRWLVQQAVQNGSLPSVRAGRRILIPRARLLSWLDGGASASQAGIQN